MDIGLQTLTQEQKQHFETEGYLIVKGLFSKEDIAEIERTFEEISHSTIPGHFEPVIDAEHNDPLKRYPRVMHPHRFNETAKHYMLHKPVLDVLGDLFEEQPLAAQSMFYYKPPGSRGQALHQDNFYLKVEPGNCIAAWTAIDAADEENGGLLVVPKTNHYEIICPEKADVNESFTNHYVKPPKDQKVIPAIMEKGDVLFFNGNLIHGSYRNRSKDRFRRAFICHYANESAARISHHYRPLFRADGTPVDLEMNPDGGLVELNMKPSIPISSNSPRMDVQMSWWAMNGLHSSEDRQSAWSQEAKLQRIAEAGFAGVNAFIPEPAQAKEWRRLLEQYGLTLSVNAYPKSAADMIEFIEKLRAYDGAVQYVNAQVMTPFIIDTRAEQLLHDIARLAEDAGIHVFIETHRGTITQDLLRTVEYVNSLPSLRLTIDFSHYVVAGEMRTISDEAEALLQTLLTRTSCIHARVSNGEQVQVNVGEQGEHPMLSHFERWWESGMRSWLAQASHGDHFPFVCELGPPPYAITLDEYGDKSDEISNRWTQSLLLADRARGIWSRILKSQGSTGLA